MINLFEYYLFVSTCILLIFSTFFSNSTYYSTYKQNIFFYYTSLLNQQSPLLSFFIFKTDLIDLIKTLIWSRSQFNKKLKRYFFVYLKYFRSIFIPLLRKKKIVDTLYFFPLHRKDYINMNFILINFIIYIYITMIILFILNIHLSIDFDFFQKEWILDNLLVISKFLILLMAFFYFIFIRSYLKLNNTLKNEFFIMLQFAILSLILLLNSEDFFELYISLEMYGLSIISVIGLKYYNRTTIEAGFKYFLITAVSSLFFLFSFSLIYITTGTYDFTDLKLLLDGLIFFEHVNFYIILFSFFMLTLSFLIKFGSFPFNFWLIDSYQSFPLITIFFLLTFPKFVITIIICKIYFYAFSIFSTFSTAIFLYALVSSSLINNLAALYQTKLKKLFIYGSFANLPFFLLVFYLHNHHVIIAFLSFFFIYYFNLLSIFLIYMLLAVNLKSYVPLKLTYVVNLYKINSIIAITFTTFLLSLSGLPPFSGFFAKFYFLINLSNNGSFLLCFFLLFTNLLTIFYYIRIVKLIFQTNYNFKYINIVEKSSLILLSILFILNLSFFFYFDSVYNLFFMLLMTIGIC